MPQNRLQKVGECLYRYSSNGVYYARIKTEGKEFKRSLGTTDRALAKRHLARLKEELRRVDRSQGRITLAELSARYLSTLRHQKPKTIERKEAIVKRLLRHWPTGNQTQVSRVRPSDVDVWLSCFDFGPASRNLFISCVKEVFDLAVRDRMIPSSPAGHLHYSRRERPIRLTPTWEKFRAIIAEVRAQQFNADAQDSADFLEFLGLAGVGQAEAVSLTRADVDFDAGRMITFRHKTSSGIALPIFPQLRPLLERLCEGKASEDRIFGIQDAKRAIAGACKRLGLPQFSQRTLRRMFITRAIELGVDVKVIAEWQGHRDGGKLILDTYSHVNPVHSQRMAALMSTHSDAQNIIALPTAT
jgi:integrase